MASKKRKHTYKPCPLAMACDGKEIRESASGCQACLEAQRRRKPIPPRGVRLDPGNILP